MASSSSPPKPDALIDPSTVPDPATYVKRTAVVSVTVPGRCVGGLTAALGDALYGRSEAFTVRHIIPTAPAEQAEWEAAANFAPPKSALAAQAKGANTAGAGSAPAGAGSGAAAAAGSGQGGKGGGKKRRSKRSKHAVVAPEAAVVSVRVVERRASDCTLSLSELLDAVLPPADVVPRPSAFETAGHVARINLDPQQWPWRRIIGRALIARHGGISVVVAKTDSIGSESVFRTLPLEVVAGPGTGEPAEPIWIQVRESDCRFDLDYRAVYWNSRLSSEHRRLSDDLAAAAMDGCRAAAAAGAPATVAASGGASVADHAASDGAVTGSRKRARSDSARPNSARKDGPSSGTSEGPSGVSAQSPLPDLPAARVLDMTAGVGPFAVPLAKRGLRVRANDLNPASVTACVANGRRNGCETALAPWGDAGAVEAHADVCAESLAKEDDRRVAAAEATTNRSSSSSSSSSKGGAGSDNRPPMSLEEALAAEADGDACGDSTVGGSASSSPGHDGAAADAASDGAAADDDEATTTAGRPKAAKRPALASRAPVERLAKHWQGIRAVSAEAAGGSAGVAPLLCSCEDAAAAVRRAGGTLPIESGSAGATSAAWPFAAAVSNLPASGVRLLSSFRGAIDQAKWGDSPLPLIVTYCFARSTGTNPGADDVADGVRRRAAMALDPAFHAACVAHAAETAAAAAAASGGSAGGAEVASLASDPFALLDDVPAYEPVEGEPALPAWAAAGGSGGVTVRSVRDVSPRKLMVRLDVAHPPAALVLCRRPQ
ncbi:hypothetical protein FNF29_07859 [Cafeteria roenbergensis]|uniref:SAM-dependent methyltransferase TRM5/TYW2-type domain-containing protein n=1 Tax=Cafeteria roenbergensis TaxID=33653 RepID=A0A5A8C1H2_CAFRO|nr:hypothetical protein FNF29_07859 [Cafeteria roenbergensis]|eukprot:KAA0146738.1 hypothetical protein FNF29_07859 [Cafeteria roenbergensis]